MVLEIPGGIFGQQDVRETPAATSSSTSSTSILAPVGSIMPWLKSFTNTPQVLPTGWMEADGSAISDADSVYNGQNAPDLNGSEFIRGAATSGGTGGGTTGAGTAHLHSFSDTSSGPSDEIKKESSVTDLEVSGRNHTHTVSGNTGNESAHTHASQPKYYDVVWIFRFK